LKIPAPKGRNLHWRRTPLLHFRLSQHNKSFCAKEGLNFKLLADSSHAVVQEYGSIMEHNGITVAARNTFLIDSAGVIRKFIST